MLSDHDASRNARRFTRTAIVSALHGAFSTLFLSQLAAIHSAPGVLLLLCLLAIGAWTRRRRFPIVPASIEAELSFAGAAGATLFWVGPAAASPICGVIAAVLGGACAQTVRTVMWRHRLTSKDHPHPALVLAIGVDLALCLRRLFTDELYVDPIVHAEESRFQRIVLTKRDTELRLYLDGALQFSSIDEALYHRGLVEPALALVPHANHVLILGGGDGLAVRELLHHEQIRRIVVVDLDARVTRLARTFSELVALNEGALFDPRVELIHQDAAAFLEAACETWDLILADLPDPETPELQQLYGEDLYRTIARRLAPGGAFVTQATSPQATPKMFHDITTALSAAELHLSTWTVTVPSFVDTGFAAGRVQI